jgi:predicted AlkP superfamily phosphohydrolase/phosphomutase
MYRKMDDLVGKTLEFVDETTALFVLSDHGFCSFRRGVNLNSWLRDHGYLRLKAGARAEAPFFEDVDWSGTRAFALGLGGIYLNIAGREGQGIVESGPDSKALKRSIIQGLCELREVTGESPIRTVYETSNLYRGPYLSAAPDLIVGYQEGYRVSWESAVGRLTPEVLMDNPKAWSGDHCVDPVLVPGVLFSNRAVTSSDPGIEDLAPTVLSLFGIAAPGWMEGKCLV